jgi:hypothetical protein
LSVFLRLPRPGGPGSCIYFTQEQVAQLFPRALGTICEVEAEVTLRLTVSESVSTSWCRAPLWDMRPDITFCRSVAVLFVWGALSDDRTGLQFAAKSLNGPSRAEPVTKFQCIVLSKNGSGVMYAGHKTALQQTVRLCRSGVWCTLSRTRSLYSGYVNHMFRPNWPSSGVQIGFARQMLLPRVRFLPVVPSSVKKAGKGEWPMGSFVISLSLRVPEEKDVSGE